MYGDRNYFVRRATLRPENKNAPSTIIKERERDKEKEKKKAGFCKVVDEFERAKSAQAALRLIQPCWQRENPRIEAARQRGSGWNPRNERAVLGAYR